MKNNKNVFKDNISQINHTLSKHESWIGVLIIMCVAFLIVSVYIGFSPDNNINVLQQNSLNLSEWQEECTDTKTFTKSIFNEEVKEKYFDVICKKECESKQKDCFFIEDGGLDSVACLGDDDYRRRFPLRKCFTDCVRKMLGNESVCVKKILVKNV